MSLNRRDFLFRAVPAGMAVGAAPAVALGQGYGVARPAAPAATVNERTVALVGDAAPVSPAMHLQQMLTLVQGIPHPADTYLAGGAVEELETMFATLLGKEDCAFMPTGTLANNLAVRILCGEHKHALVQAESHLYADESDAASILSGLTLDPLPPLANAPWSYEEVASAIEALEHRPYPIRVGAISIESPVRRADGQAVPFEMIEKISAMAKQKGIGMHWDGARSMLLTGTPGFDLKRTSALFDTVYVSLYKYLGAPFGAVLAGTRDSIARARELRHIYGGLIYHGWETVLAPLHAAPGFADRYLHAHAAMQQVLQKLTAAGGFTVHPVPNGSNIVHLEVSPERARGLHERLVAADIRAAMPREGSIPIYTNESILRRSPAEIAAAFTG